MMSNIPFSKIIAIGLLFLTTSVAQAQKLPGKQEVSLRAPLNLKIDGKATEWDPFQAFNHQTEIFYTISNDDTNLYLAVQATESTVIGKIMGGGITLVIQQTDKKDDKNGISINYPVLDQTLRQGYVLKRRNEAPAPAGMADKIGDSIMIANNIKLMAVSKTIKIKGVAGLDTLVSIYNDDGVKAAGLFNNKKEFTCEMAISLKLLGLSVNDASKFNYHILLNAGSNKYTASGLRITGSRDANGVAASQAAVDEMNQKLSMTMQTLYATTDFWGEYTLAKK